MGTFRYVFLDPDGTGGQWLYVVVAGTTGVVYQQQYGGTANRNGEIEGYLVPAHAPDALTMLRRLFEGHFRGAGTFGHRWTDDEKRQLQDAVARVPYWASDGDTDQPHPLRLDHSRFDDVDEAWIPVITPDGPGQLVWRNSD